MNKLEKFFYKYPLTSFAFLPAVSIAVAMGVIGCTMGTIDAFI